MDNFKIKNNPDIKNYPITRLCTDYIDEWCDRFNIIVNKTFYVPSDIMERVFPNSLGVCRCNSDYEISIILCTDIHYDLNELYHTIRHEIAHAICFVNYKYCVGHGPEWIDVAKKMNVDVSSYSLW